MKKGLLIFSLLLINSAIFAQRQTPVTWSYKAIQVDAKQYDLVFTAEIEPNWYLYSQHLEEGGPIPTSFELNDDDGFEKVGETKEEGDDRQEGHDDLFDMEVITFKKKAMFTQRIKLTGNPESVSGYLEFMTCNGEQCLPPTQVEFTIDL